jgi:hypothetical protein
MTMNTMEKGQQGGHGQPGHDRDKDKKQGQQQQEPGRNPQPGGGQGRASARGSHRHEGGRRDTLPPPAGRSA